MGPGIIPARAGFTPPRLQFHHGRPDHPRSRGVYLADITYTFGNLGSSPLARGLLARATMGTRNAGIIPARAGFTFFRRTMIRPCPDHPRSRGVYSCPPSPRASTDGSSPLARGLPPDSFPSPSTPRIIPARAGFTRPAPPPSTTCGDHPRSRGVYGVCAASRAPSSGSSPLARGLQGAVVDSSPAHGIIPARAGFTRRQARRGGHHGDHPRSRGVYTTPGSARRSPRGSSPLARGLHHRRLATARS